LRLEEAESNESKAQRHAAEATTEAIRLRELAEDRARLLAEAQATTASGARQDVGRLASSLLRPVAKVVADSYESESLESLQDQLLAILERARILQIIEVGEIATFDPVRHQWVGEGSPPDRVQAKSPGFLMEDEGGNEIVVVPARVSTPGS
jgi:hypothetical protein